MTRGRGDDDDCIMMHAHMYVYKYNMCMCVFCAQRQRGDNVCVYVVSKIPLGTPRDPFDRGNGSEGR